MGFTIDSTPNGYVFTIENKNNGGVTNIIYDGLYHMSGLNGVEFKRVLEYIENSYIHQHYYKTGLTQASFKLFKRSRTIKKVLNHD